MILTFKCRDTERIWDMEPARRFSVEVQRAARRKLVMLDAAQAVQDLRLPPGNRLEALKGDRSGQYSIRVNEQYRLCFVWTGRDAEDVELVDYH
ncbi:MAG: type II toxin-antitoxin system RelE/ParE family toxin [Desulfovibrio sp.]|jgi:proteic killer suppression protein|nr:type II toxin-antitoxin system RelE/ParE family toxin [Desulfovibrio sp.]